MKIYLLPEKGSYYKANLHSHSTVSDGKWSPEEMKKNYMAEGYSIVAYTDHQVFVTHNDLTDENFLALNGYEVDIPEDKPWGEYAKTCHFCLIALDKERTLQRIYHDSVFIDQNADKVNIDKEHAPIVRRYDPEFISALMKEAREDGFFVTYNHPVWSLETNDEYLKYHGMHAMEVVNYSSCVTGHNDRGGTFYENKINSSENIYCVAADDNHNTYPIDHPKCDSFGGFTMIKAERLEYSAIAKALLDGDFYASEGPQIFDLYFNSDDGRVYINTSEAISITMSLGARYNSAKTASKKGDTITEASFTMNRKEGEYIRFIVRDASGREAHTRAYPVSEIYKKLNETN